MMTPLLSTFTDIINLSLVEKGGLVMWLLLLASLIGFTLFIERTLYLHRGQIRTESFLTGLKNLLRKRLLVEALTMCEETPGPVPNVVKAALLHHDQGEGAMKAAVESAALVEIPNLERRIASIAAIGRVSPMLGLLGTVIGLFKAFNNFQTEGAYANVEILAIGFGEALITTATGLGIAIMAYLAHHFLHGRVRALVHDMEWAAHTMIQFLVRDLPEEDEALPSPVQQPSEQKEEKSS